MVRDWLPLDGKSYKVHCEGTRVQEERNSVAIFGLLQQRNQKLALCRGLWEGFPDVRTFKLGGPEGNITLAFTGTAG